MVEGARRSHEDVVGGRVGRDSGVAADGEEVAEGGAAVEQGVEEGVEGMRGAGLREGRVREGAARGGGEAGAAVGGDDAAEEVLAGPGAVGGVGGWEAGEDGLHRGEEARGGELRDDEVVAAEAVAECGGRLGVRRVEEEAERDIRVRLLAEGGDEVARRELLAGHGGGRRGSGVQHGRHEQIAEEASCCHQNGNWAYYAKKESWAWIDLLSPCYVGLKSPEILYTFRKDFFPNQL